ncbi:MAG: carboxypeptidase-like regulatory domain-containing protein [bacterium]
MLPFFTLKCGDKICSATETCYTCSEDCGKCEPIPTAIPGITIPPILPTAVREIIETPVGSATTKAITTTGIVATVAVTAFAFPFSLLELLFLPLRLMGILLIAFGLKKRNPPWGVVYDSVTKQPLDPAYVTLLNPEGKEISSAISDLDGRYGFLADPGFYKLSAHKTNYVFPSQKLAGKSADELYNNLYFGDPVEVEKDQAIIKNIPLDPLKFDWNEFAKQDKRLTKFYSKWDMLFRKISDLIYYFGFAVAIIAFFAAPYPYNLIILGLYVFLLMLRILGVKPRPFGSVIDKSSGTPLQFGILRIISPDSDKEISHKVTDKYGRYFCLIPKGRYYVKIEKKNNDGSYSLVHTSHVIDATKTGLIKERFWVLEKNIDIPSIA